MLRITVKLNSMKSMILSAPYINNFNDVGGSMSQGNIRPKLYLTCIVPTIL